MTASAFLTAGCGGGAAAAPPTVTDDAPAKGTGAIRHVVVIVQENRSFDNVFSGFPGADGAVAGKLHDGQTMPLATVSLANPTDLAHTYNDFLTEYDGGKMDGFDHERYNGPPVPPSFSLAKVDRSEIGPYWNLASTYTLADRMFASNQSDSFAAHQYLIAAQDADVIGSPNLPPWGCDAPPQARTEILNAQGQPVPGPFPCFDYPTLAASLDAAGASWKYYAPKLHGDFGGQLWDAFDAIRAVRYGSDWANVVSPQTTILSDIGAGRLANVTWVVPSFADSDHSASRSTSGPQWVGSIVNALGHSVYWKDTAIFILWDDWGGWYDHVPPPQLAPGSLGMRVPLIVVSQFAKRGYVSHVPYEFGSIVKFVETSFGLPSLAQTDVRAAALDDCFDFTQPAQPYRALLLRRSTRSFLSEPVGDRAPDDD